MEEADAYGSSDVYLTTLSPSRPIWRLWCKTCLIDIGQFNLSRFCLFFRPAMSEMV